MLDMTEYQALYMEELDEQLRVMEEEVLRLERKEETLEGIQRLFRAAHTLKGSSAVMGYERMKRLTHNMEHILEKVRNQECEVTQELATLFFRCVDRMKQLRTEIVARKHESSGIDDLVDALASGDWPNQVNELRRIDRGNILLSVEEVNHAVRHLEQGDRAYWIRIGLTPDCEMRTARFHLILAWLAESSTNVLWTDAIRPMEGEDEESKRSCRCLILSDETSEAIQSRALAWIDVGEVEIEDCGRVELEALAQRERDDEADLMVSNDSESSASSPLQDKARVQSIRVNVDRLEKLMNLVGELVIDQTRVRQVERSLASKFGTEDSLQELGQITDHITRIIGELQESVMKVRMLPIEQLFNRFPRMIRDMSQSLGKDVELSMEGKDTELDRTLIEELGDPLIHLLRNAVDHGIEMPETRRAQGKPLRGKITISASHEDNQVLIVVEDDGAGIDPRKLVRKAVSQRLISQSEADRYTDKEAVDLIFHAGLSTASQVSDISGRGVGMDIVRAGIERMNGRIDIETNAGEGTRFKIRLPLTLAIITGLLVRVGGRTFIIPMSNVAEIVRLSHEDIHNIKGIPIVTIRNQVIPIAWIHDIFGYPNDTARSKSVPVVIVGRAEKRYALAVDELLGNQEIVIKSLGAFVGQSEGIAGATILGDGKVALILEIGGIIRRMGRA
ncbi:chemotaxis protein CheA [Cohnella endophytica]|uniref:Chemotaxis protein CheA n=1 Tax=Cohnella endophytica TaxID=2419778 RepID=A0A494XDF8_9BACL|nr:chemotaxis protein CheA [Cohnella endophytica]RKP48795.1 chemotaxis protein CheA [Cohnella endophytica]